MRLVFLMALAILACGASLSVGVYARHSQVWPIAELRSLVASALRDPRVQMDRFGRLQNYPGKTAIACPPQDDSTAVLLIAGQSNAANYQAQSYQSPDDQVVNYVDGSCYRAGSPVLGADGHRGESWTLLGMKLVRSGLYKRVVLVPAAVGGSPMSRWAPGGDLNAMLMEVIRGLRDRYVVTAILWDQGASDFELRTPGDRYEADLKSMIDQIRAEGVAAPFFITRCSVGGADWTADNAIARAQAALADGKTIFDGPDTDRDVTPLDRFDGAHFAASGQEKWTDTWVELLRAHRGGNAG